MPEPLNRTVILFQDETGMYCASCPSLVGCHSQGETFDEAVANIREAIELYIEDLIEAGDPIPEDTYQAVTV